MVVISILTFLAFAFCLLALYVLVRRKYTRERYAFAALGATVNIVALAVSSIFTPPWTALFHVTSKLFDISIVMPPEPHWSEKMLAVMFCIYAVWLIHRLHSNWHGPISKRQYELERVHDSNGLFIEGVKELSRILRKEAPSPIYKPLKQTMKINSLIPTSELKAWRDDARELVEIKYQQYYFDIDNDWHERGNCWLGEDKKTEELVALLCLQVTPSDVQLAEFVNYIGTIAHVQLERVQFHVAVQGDISSPVSYVSGRKIVISSEKELVDGLANFTDYQNEIKRRVTREMLPDSSITIEQLYVPSRLRDASGKEISQNLEEYLLEWLNEISERQLAILGEYGQGKSTGTLMFVHKILSSDLHLSSRIPILIELRGKSPANLQPIELLGAWASQYRIDPKAVMKLLAKGRIAVIFEGFDEMAGVGEFESRLNHFRALWKFCMPGAKLLFTGRPNLFLDDTELKQSLGIGESVVAGPYCEHLHLQFFDYQQIENSLRWVLPTIKNEIIGLANRDEKFFDVINRPSLLYIVARLWESQEFQRITEKVNAAGVMGAFIQHCYRRQTEKLRGHSDFMVLTEKERKYFTDGIAVYMAAWNLPNQIMIDEFNEAIAQLYANIPDLPAESAESPKLIIAPLKRRLADRENVLEIIQSDVRTCGLLVRDYSKPSAFKFPHKSFYEFLLGAFAADAYLKKHPGYFASIRTSTEFSLSRMTKIPEAIGFMAELLANDPQNMNDKRFLTNALFDLIVIPDYLDNRLFKNSFYRDYLLENATKRQSRKRRLFGSILYSTLMCFILTAMLKYPQSVVFQLIMVVITSLIALFGFGQVIGEKLGIKVYEWYRICLRIGMNKEILISIYGNVIYKLQNTARYLLNNED